MNFSGRRLNLPSGLIAALLFVLLLTRSAVASRSLVVLVVAEPPAAELVEAYVRLQAELRAAGFEVQPTAGLPHTEPESALAAAARELRPAAAIGIFENPSGALELWILDARSRRTTLRRMARGSEPGRAPEILAISAVELLLAGLAELDIKPAPAQTSKPAASVAREGRDVETRSALSEHPRFGLELGVGAAVSMGGVGVAWLPAARLQWAPRPALRLRLSGLGLGTQPEIAGPGGSAKATQGMALVDLVLRPWELSRIRPQLSLGFGAYYFGIDGRATDGSAGATASEWSPALATGAGLSLRLHRKLELVAEVHALWAARYPSIRFAGTEAATAGRPTLVFSAAVGGWL